LDGGELVTTLYDRVGGEAALFAAATLLYEKLLGDPRVSGFFAGLDMDALIRKQTAFLAWAFGAPERYTFRPLDEAHRKLVRERGLADEHFDIVAGHLADTLRELKVEPLVIDEVMVVVGSTRRAVLG
jgi:hemoglobin